MSEPFDADEWAKEDCACEHPRYAHLDTGNGSCQRCACVAFEMPGESA